MPMSDKRLASSDALISLVLSLTKTMLVWRVPKSIESHGCSAASAVPSRRALAFSYSFLHGLQRDYRRGSNDRGRTPISA